jgi:hypothetical protein
MKNEITTFQKVLILQTRYKGKIGKNPKGWRSGRSLMLSVKLIFFKFNPDLIDLYSEKVLTISEFMPK